MLEFFEVCETRYELIVTLMAVLELCKANQLEIDQTEPFGTIHVRPGTKFHEQLILQSDGNSAPPTLRLLHTFRQNNETHFFYFGVYWL